MLRSQLIVAGGELHVDNCTFDNSSADAGGALRVTAGTLAVHATAFVGTSARRGGAVHVSGGASTFSGCAFEGCSASEAQGGGALFVEGGSVVVA